MFVQPDKSCTGTQLVFEKIRWAINQVQVRCWFSKNQMGAILATENVFEKSDGRNPGYRKCFGGSVRTPPGLWASLVDFSSIELRKMHRRPVDPLPISNSALITDKVNPQF